MNQTISEKNSPFSVRVLVDQINYNKGYILKNLDICKSIARGIQDFLVGEDVDFETAMRLNTFCMLVEKVDRSNTSPVYNKRKPFSISIR